jgi:glycosyltransferase involved in cell wall biosynthesis
LRIVFVSWTKFASRSESIARAFGGKSFYFGSPNRFRMIFAPVLYAIKSVQTMAVLMTETPDVVFAMNPPTFVPLNAYIYSLFKRVPFVVDSHSAAFDSKRWQWLMPLHRFIARRATFSLVTARQWEKVLSSWEAKCIVLDDPPMRLEGFNTKIDLKKRFNFSNSLNICFVNTFGADEPLDKVLGAAREMNDVRFFITGSLKRAPNGFQKGIISNVTFTDYLENDAYYSLLSAVDAIMVLTDRENTMQNGGMEAIAVGKPLITSDTAFLKNTFSKGTIHVENTVRGIVSGIQKIRGSLAEYTEEMKTLKKERDLLWEEKKKEIAQMCQGNERSSK